MLSLKRINTGNKLVIFDLDDTIVKTRAKVKLIHRHTGKVIKEMTPDEFNRFQLDSKKHVLNFDDFSDPEILRQGKFIHKIFSKLKSYYKKGIPVSIVTGRSSSDLVRDFFLDHGIDIHPQLVIAVGDPQYGYKGSIAQKKSQAIKDLIDFGFKVLTFFDDSEENLRLARQIEGYKDSSIRLIHVD